MSSVPIPPPLPPPTSNAIHNENINAKVICISNTNLDVNNNCKWAVDSLELQEACTRNKICIDHKPHTYSYRYFESILQVGPTCGLVALCMLVKNKVTADELLNISRELGFTNHGEMLSTTNLFKLSDKVLKLCNLSNVRVSVRNNGLFTNEIVEKLLSGAVCLVPYDADFNHSPGLKKGHTAHWALVCGVIITDNPGESYNSNSDNIYVFAKHGKSKYLQVWKLDSLDKSNKNLWEFSPKKKEDGLSYVVPDGDIGSIDGLRSQFILLEGL